MKDAFKTLAQESAEASVWNVRPFQIVSLLEMIEFFASPFVHLMSRLAAIQATIKAQGGNLQSEEEINGLRFWLNDAEAACDRYELDIAGCLSRLRQKIVEPEILTGLPDLILELRHRISDELEQRLFMYMPASAAEKFEKDDLFGSEVKAQFPAASADVKAIGNCYATGNYTACVFHCMRVVELGARAMVRGLKVQNRLTDKHGVRIPVELSEWGKLTHALQTGTNQLSAGARTDMRKKKKHEFYSHALATFLNFKDAWRNHVSHTREKEPYDEFKAMIVMTNTKHFMAHLSTRLNRPRGNAPIAETDDGFVRW